MACPTSFEARLLTTLRNQTGDNGLVYTTLSCAEDPNVILMRMRTGDTGSAFVLQDCIRATIPLASVSVEESGIDGCQEVFLRFPRGATAQQHARHLAREGVCAKLLERGTLLMLTIAIVVYILQHVSPLDEL